ncbi:type II secretion system protein, partial [Campylobacter sp.]|uniref:type II secretion system protein n=1 Tax=Campylobacter sp. TaxID=205 RepID=UPI0039C34C65
MIELIFVIVILGILASVAIPRLASTREDAEISATVANLRTLLSDASAYYVGHGKFNTGATGGFATWNDVTNVPLKRANGNDIDATDLVITQVAGDNGAYLIAGKLPCIGVQLVNRATREGGGGFVPAHIKFTQHATNATNDPVCAQVIASAPIAAYFSSTIPNGTGAAITAAIPVG